eukprot:TRINITY_DN126_c0_g1_i2.p1 TRINITY_DN126_c0_g1~~TRINITY_DN126_c0_g1_i2.p1  ORF type:complete len:319 (-),score=39.11 TRINITY_DN126_c0_g1_i2:681-1637(-)
MSQSMDSVDSNATTAGISSASSTPRNHSKPKKKKVTWMEHLVKGYHTEILWQVLLVPIAPFIVVLVQTIIWPGLKYCNEDTCPHSFEPAIPDAAMLPIAFILYVYATILGVTLLLSSGAWMDHGFRTKILVCLMLFLMACSTLQLIPAVIYRGYLLPLRAVQPYNLTVQRLSDTSALFTASNLYNSAVTDGDEVRVMVQVRRVSSGTTDIRDVSPASHIIYEDEDFDETTLFGQGDTLTREVYGLEDGKWYMWLVLPARKGPDGNAHPAKYIRDLDDPPSSFDGERIDDDDDLAVDLRAYKRCQWDELVGCSEDGQIH